MALALLVACSPQRMAEDMTRAAAKSVILPVVGQRLPETQAEQVTACVLDNATLPELQALARDVGTRAGTRTVAVVADVLRRPGTVQCVARLGLPGIAS
ncbi:hypothetical protein [Szabonella alba]|uniref:hypothetical protein n=1 Tax=Szabonella alba TaxID=2804194 RepID=UPI001F19DF92|nr:hypothetical protein [Szabonella alba]